MLPPRRKATAPAAWSLIAAFTLAGCSTPPVAPELPAIERIAADFTLDALWYRQPQQPAAPARAVLPPILLDGRLYHADRPGRLVALDPRNGRLLWRADLSPPDGSPETAVELSGGIGSGADMLLVGTRQGSVIALDPADGTVIWQSQLSSEVAAAPSASGRIVIARSNDGRLYALDAATGARLWVYDSAAPPLSLRGTGRPVIDDDQIYAGFSSGKLVALALATGEVLWELAVGVPEGRSEFERLVDVDADPVLAANTVFAASYQNRLVAVSTVSGRVVWSRDMSIFNNLAVDGNRLFVSTEQDEVMAIDRATGNIVWRQDLLAQRGISAPVLYRGRLGVADREGYLHWLSTDDGARIGRHRLIEGAITAPMQVIDGVLYVIDSQNGLHALRAAGT